LEAAVGKDVIELVENAYRVRGDDLGISSRAQLARKKTTMAGAARLCAR
jgi:hypothetical protein